MGARNRVRIGLLRGGRRGQRGSRLPHRKKEEWISRPRKISIWLWVRRMVEGMLRWECKRDSVYYCYYCVHINQLPFKIARSNTTCRAPLSDSLWVGGIGSVETSVAYPGSDFFPSRIPDLNFSHPGFRIFIKEFKYFNHKKMVSKL